MSIIGKTTTVTEYTSVTDEIDVNATEKVIQQVLAESTFRTTSHFFVFVSFVLFDFCFMMTNILSTITGKERRCHRDFTHFTQYASLKDSSRTILKSS